MSTPKFIVQHQDEQLGPFDEQELKARWEAHEILGIDYVYDEDKQDWVLLAERFRWAAAGHLDDTMPIKIQPNPALTEEIPLEAEPVLEIEEDLPPAVPAPAAAPVPARGPEVHLVNGRAEVSLADLKPGHFSFKISHGKLVAEELHVDVRPAEPVRVRWAPPAEHVVGHELELRFEAVDADDKPCAGFAGEFTVVVGGAKKRHDVKTIDGVGVVRWTHTKAEAWTIHLEFRGQAALVMPAKHKLEWLAGPAERLVLDGPSEYPAGSPLKVQVKAVDAYGNVARDFQGTVVLDVKAG